MTNYNTRRNNNNKVLKWFKDYLFPIIVVGVIFLFVLNYIFSGNETATPTQNNSAFEVSLWAPDTESYVVFSGGNKTKIDGKVQVNQSEKLQVVNGNLSIKNGETELSLNKLWELRYNEDGGYTLYSSDLWVKSNSGMNIEMRYAKIASNGEAVFSLSQNEVASTIYVVSGIVDIQNLAGKSASLQKGEKLVIMRNNANDEASDLSLSKEQIDDYIKTDDWFIKNNGSFYLSTTDTTTSSWTTASGETLSGSTDLTASTTSGSEYITFSNLCIFFIPTTLRK